MLMLKLVFGVLFADEHNWAVTKTFGEADFSASLCFFVVD